MILFLTIIFLAALAALVALFALKAWETSSGRVLLPGVRESADRKALYLKEVLRAGEADFARLPLILLSEARATVRGIAIDAGFVAHWIGRCAHRLADRLSHKRGFSPRETRSEFLKKMSEHKNDADSESPASNI